MIEFAEDGAKCTITVEMTKATEQFSNIRPGLKVTGVPAEKADEYLAWGMERMRNVLRTKKEDKNGEAN